MSLETLITAARAGDETARRQLRELPRERRAGAAAQPSSLDPEARTVRAMMTTEEPVEMIDWERWEMVPEVLRADGMDAPGQVPFLDAHNPRSVGNVLGSVRDFGPAGDGVEGTITFARTEAADEALGLVADGHVTDVSVGYDVTGKIYVPSGEKATIRGKTYEGPVNVATRWKLRELSLVPIGADPNAKLRAALNDFTAPPSGRAPNLPATSGQPATEHTMTASTVSAPGPAVENPEDIRRQSQADERARIAEIDAMCAKHNIPADLRGKWIGDDTSIESARGLVLDYILTRGGKPAPAANMGDGFSPDLSEREKKAYSFIRAVNAAITGNWRGAGLEQEISNDIAKRMGRSPGEGGSQGNVGMGFFAPTNIPWYAPEPGRAFDYSVGTAGSGTTGGTLVATNLLAGSFIEVLRNRSRVMQLGATVLSGLVGNVDIPRQTGASTAAWLAETDDTSQTAATFGKVSLAPKHLGARSLITRAMLMQSTPDIEMLVRADLVAVMALAIDAGALYGTGSSNQPRGISNQSGIGSVVGGTNGAAITIDHLIDLETALTSSNAPEDTIAYLANAKTVGALKKLKSTTGQYLWTSNPTGRRDGTPGEINGYPVARSNQARSTLTKGSTSGSCSEIYFGAWAELVIGEWGVLEILPNPYDPAAYNSGGVLLRAIQSVDIAVRHAVSFAVMSDATTA